MLSSCDTAKVSLLDGRKVHLECQICILGPSVLIVSGHTVSGFSISSEACSLSPSPTPPPKKADCSLLEKSVDFELLL